MLAGSDRVLFGAAYYHEYQPYDRLDVDLDLFVASFIGSPSMNFVRAEIVAEKDLLLARCADVDIPVPAENVALRAYVGKTVALGVRPEDLHLASGDPAPRVSGVVVLTEVLGSKMLAHVEVAGEPVATEDVLEGLVDEGDVSDVTSLRTVGAARLSPSSSRTRRSWPAISHRAGRESAAPAFLRPRDRPGHPGRRLARHQRLTRESRGLRRRSSRSARLVAVWRA